MQRPVAGKQFSVPDDEISTRTSAAGTSASFRSQVKRRLSLQHAVKNFKSKLGTSRSSSTHRTSDGYLYFPDSEVVGYPVSVEQEPPHSKPRGRNSRGSINITRDSLTEQIKFPSNSSVATTSEQEDVSDTLNEEEEERMKELFHMKEKDEPKENTKLAFAEMQEEHPRRRPSINLYQSVDDDHPDLQSIQSIVANMNFSAD